MGALNGVWLPFYTWLLYGPHGHSPPCQPLTWGQDVHARPHAPQQVTKVHEPPREDTVPPKPVPPVPPPTQHLQPEGDVSQQSGGSPRGKSRSPVPPAEKEAEKPAFFPAFPTEGPKLPTEPPRWSSGLPFPIPPREVIKTSPHAADPSAFSYTPPGEWTAHQLGLCSRWAANSFSVAGLHGADRMRPWLKV